MTRKINSSRITKTIARLCEEANFELPKDVVKALKEAKRRESSSTEQEIIAQILKNSRIAAQKRIPICQDCGTAVIFFEIGQNVLITGKDLFCAAQEGVYRGYNDNYLRKSVCDPLTRKNTRDNTPPIVHIKIVPGDKLKIIVCAQGGGCENMSALKMLTPAQGEKGIKKFVIDTIKKAGPNPCPPTIIGIGIGGNFEEAPLLAKKALLRPVNQTNKNNKLAAIEKELLQKINKLEIGLGGDITALSVKIETAPCHIASLPVAISISCHAIRRKEAIL